jgi:Zn-dependent protease with chaperone function
MITFEGHYFDGRHPISVPARIDFSDREATLTAGPVCERYEISLLRVSPRIASSDRFILLPGAGQFTCADHVFMDSLPQESRSEGPVAWLEQRWGIALACAAIIFSTLLAGYFIGLPVAAERIAARIPMRAEQPLGRQTLSWFDEKGWCKPTSLDFETRMKIRQGFDTLCTGLPSKDYYQLEFRSSTVFGPNAFALPGGIIVITDEMVKAAATTEEVLAVLAHEIGHVELRHTMRSVLQGSVVAAAAAIVTSDAASLSVAVAGLPAVLAGTKYSREFEAAADAYAFRLLKLKGYSPAAFASLLERLAKKDAKQTGAFAYISSHPLTAERVQRARAAAEQ